MKGWFYVWAIIIAGALVFSVLGAVLPTWLEIPFAIAAIIAVLAYSHKLNKLTEPYD